LQLLPQAFVSPVEKRNSIGVVGIGHNAFAGIYQHCFDAVLRKCRADNTTGEQLAGAENVIGSARRKLAQSGNTAQHVLHRVEQRPHVVAHRFGRCLHH
jgi:hypothetical protein